MPVMTTVARRVVAGVPAVLPVTRVSVHLPGVVRASNIRPATRHPPLMRHISDPRDAGVITEVRDSRPFAFNDTVGATAADTASLDVSLPFAATTDTEYLTDASSPRKSQVVAVTVQTLPPGESVAVYRTPELDAALHEATSVFDVPATRRADATKRPTETCFGASAGGLCDGAVDPTFGDGGTVDATDDEGD